jgi:hypothetical protein
LFFASWCILISKRSMYGGVPTLKKRRFGVALGGHMEADPAASDGGAHTSMSRVKAVGKHVCNDDDAGAGAGDVPTSNTIVL